MQNKELRILNALKHNENIITLYDILPPNKLHKYKSLVFVFEYMDAPLRKIFRTNQYFYTLHAQYILIQILSGIQAIHSLNIAHRVLKPVCILINAQCSIKITDFGLACTV
eukprot:389237_1